MSFQDSKVPVSIRRFYMSLVLLFCYLFDIRVYLLDKDHETGANEQTGPTPYAVSRFYAHLVYINKRYYGTGHERAPCTNCFIENRTQCFFNSNSINKFPRLLSLSIIMMRTKPLHSQGQLSNDVILTGCQFFGFLF